jgi:hypothetical protein
LEELKKQIALDCEKAHCLWSRNGDKVVN